MAPKKPKTEADPLDAGSTGGQRSQSLAQYIRHSTADGSDLVDLVVGIFNGKKGGKKNALITVDMKLRLEAATWLADRGWGKPIQAQEISIRPSDEARGKLREFTLEELESFAKVIEVEYTVLPEVHENSELVETEGTRE